MTSHDDAPLVYAALTLIREDAGGRAVVNPDTGELLNLTDAQLVDLVAARLALTDLDTRRRTAVAIVDDEIIRRADEQKRAGELTQSTFTVGDYKVEIKTPGPKINGNGLRDDLMRRAALGEISLNTDAVANAFRTTYSVKQAVWKTYVQVAPELEEIADQHATPQRRSASVTRYRPPAIDATSEDDTPTPTPVLEEPPTW